MITLRGVTVSFGDKTVFDGLDWELPEAGVYLVLGANGAGKSMLLDVIAGRRKPRAGAVHLGKVPVYKLFGPDLPRMEYLRREASAEDAGTLWNVFGYRMRQSGGEEKPGEILERMTLPWTEAEMRKLRVEALPQGELLEFELLCAMSLMPKYLFIDDYFSRFSFEGCERVSANLQNWQRISGGTVLATSTRYFGFMDTFSGIYVLEGGKLRELQPIAKCGDGRSVDEPPAAGPREVLIVCGEYFYRHSRVQQENPHVELLAVLENALLISVKTTLDDALKFLDDCGIDVLSVSFRPRMDAKEYGQGVFF